MTQPLSSASLEELRRRMHLDWADGAVDGEPPLEDLDRAARLYGIVADPYHHLAFGNLSRSHLMLICIYGLLENHQWDKAFRAVACLDRMERERERTRKRQPTTGNVAAAPPPQPTAVATAPVTPSEPTPPVAPLTRAIIQGMSASQLRAFCHDRLGRSPECKAPPDTAPPFT